MSKILVTEKLAVAGIEYLAERGHEVDLRTDLSHDELVGAIGSYDAVIIRSATRLTADVIEAGKRLRVIGRAGVGVDNVDVAAATAAGIVVCNAPTSNVVSAAEHTFALILACARRIPEADASMKAGRWDRAQLSGVELYGKTLGIVGLGRIGALVAKRAAAFGMNLVGYDPYCSPERAEQLGVTLYDEVDDLLPLADFLTVHLPKTPETIGMFGPARFAKMKDGVILVNTARGGIYDVASLADFVAAGKVRAVGIDVWEDEPCTASPLHEFDQAVLTPHLGASTREAQTRASLQIAEYVDAGLSGSIVATAVNMAPVPPEVMDAVGPYVPACQIASSLLACLEDAIPAKLTIKAAGNLAGQDLSILLAGALDGLLRHHVDTTVTPVNAEAVAARRGIRMETSATSEAHEYASLVTVAHDALTCSVTLSGPGQSPRIVELLGYQLEVEPTAQALLFEGEGKPGVFGVIGSILGERGVDITTMQIGKKPGSKSTLVYMNVEGDVDEALLRELAECTDVDHIWEVRL